MPRRLYTCTPTRLSAWLDCPRRYRMSYLDRPPPQKGAAWAHNSLGASVHTALASWWRLPSGQRTVAAAGDLLERGWIDLGYADEAQSLSYRDRARRMVEEYVGRLDPAAEPLGVERTVATRTERIAVSGRVDRLDERPSADGGTELVVVDYKTGRHLLTVDDARTSLPLALYALAAERSYITCQPARSWPGSTRRKRWPGSSAGPRTSPPNAQPPTSSTGRGWRRPRPTGSSRRGPAPGAGGATTSSTVRKAGPPPSRVSPGTGSNPCLPADFFCRVPELVQRAGGGLRGLHRWGVRGSGDAHTLRPEPFGHFFLNRGFPLVIVLAVEHENGCLRRRGQGGGPVRAVQQVLGHRRQTVGVIAQHPPAQEFDDVRRGAVGLRLRGEVEIPHPLDLGPQLRAGQPAQRGHDGSQHPG